MRPTCTRCSLELVCINTEHSILVCRRCDSSHQGGGVRFGPPGLPNTDGGKFIGSWKE